MTWKTKSNWDFSLLKGYGEKKSDHQKKFQTKLLKQIPEHYQEFSSFSFHLTAVPNFKLMKNDKILYDLLEFYQQKSINYKYAVI